MANDRASQQASDRGGRGMRGIGTATPNFRLLPDVLYHQAEALKKQGQLAQARTVAAALRDRYRNHLIEPDVPMPNRQPGSRIQILLKELGME